MIKLKRSLPEFDYEIDECTFRLRRLSELELEEVNFMLAESIKRGAEVLPPSAVRFCLAKCLLDWNGVEGDDGVEPFKKGDEVFLPAKVRMELASEIYIQSQLTEDEKKS